MLFAVLFIAAMIATMVLLWVFVGVIWGALALAALVIVLYRATRQAGDASSSRETLNAFQQPLADE